jgi:iron complex outermembrane receptor protein
MNPRTIPTARTLQVLSSAVCLLALAATPAFAQPPGRLSGIIRDATNAVVPGATVTVSGPALPSPRTVTTNNQGRYEIDALPAGTYLVTATLSGLESRGVEVTVGAGEAMADLTVDVASMFERVTVTATKTGTTDVQSTPVAITALPARTLEQIGIQTVLGLQGFVPTLTVSQHTGLGQITIRGIGTNLVFVGSDPSSTMHLDGVYLARPAMVFADFLNVDRVEVLRGPQGTLYGRNSVGGTINIVTRQPTNDLEANARFTAGNYDTFRAEGAVSGPIVKDKVMANVAFIRSGRDGFVKDLDHDDNKLGGEDTWAGLGHARIVFNAGSELLLSADYGRFDGIPLTAAKPITPKPGFSYTTPPSVWEVRTNDLASGQNTQAGVSARLSVRLNDTMRLNSLTAWRTSDHHFFIDADLTEQRLQTSDYNDRQRQISEELTLVGHMAALTWIGGAYFFSEDDEQPDVKLVLYGPGLENRPFPRADARAWALFSQATYRATPRLAVTGGLRYTDERKDFANTGGVYRIGTPILAVPGSFFDYTDRVTYDAWTPRFGVDLQAARDTFLYVSAARGFKSGGFNPSTPVPGRAFLPEFAWTYEGGVKTTVGGGRVRTNAAVFYTDYQDLQVQQFIGFGILDISNAASATIKGVEIEAAARVAAGLQLSGTFSWLDAVYDQYIAVGNAGVTQDAAGNRLNNAPEWSGSTSALYEFAARSAGTVSVRGDLTWQSRVFYTAFNDAFETQAAYALTHVRAGFEPASRRWELAVYVRNLANAEYITATANFPVNSIGGRPGEPRHWGTQFTLRY